MATIPDQMGHCPEESFREATRARSLSLPEDALVPFLGWTPPTRSGTEREGRRIANREGGPQGRAPSADGIPVLRERVGWEGQVHQEELEVRPRAEWAELGVVS